MANRYGHWDTALVGEFDECQLWGFVYEIEDRLTGKSYIGKKNFRIKRQKTKKDPSRTKDSGWREYCSSCKPLCEAIVERGPSDFIFRILLLCAGKCMLSYEEESVQRARDVLRARLPNGDRKFYNNVIGYKNFNGLEKQTLETKRLRSAVV